MGTSSLLSGRWLSSSPRPGTSCVSGFSIRYRARAVSDSFPSRILPRNGSLMGRSLCGGIVNDSGALSVALSVGMGGHPFLTCLDALFGAESGAIYGSCRDREAARNLEEEGKGPERLWPLPPGAVDQAPGSGVGVTSSDASSESL